jgi:pilus assembly protein CpaF
MGLKARIQHFAAPAAGASGGDPALWAVAARVEQAVWDLELHLEATSSDALTETVAAVVAEDLAIPPLDRDRVTQLVVQDLLGFGPIQPLLDDPTVSEIMVNAPDQVWVEQRGQLILTGVAFRDTAHVQRVLEKMLAPTGRHVDEASPLVDARLPDGSRLNAVVRPIAVRGVTLTIRKFATRPFTLGQLTEQGALSAVAAEFLAGAVSGRLSSVISGGTGSGKTTLLNAVSAVIPDTERIVSIEDAAELQLQQRHWVPLEARPANIEGQGAIPIRTLVRNALRMRPDRILVGEVRGGEALDMLQAMNTGHEGSLTTIHANTPRDCLARLETMVLMAGAELPLAAIRQQIASAVQVIVQVVRGPDGRRRVDAITEVAGMESGQITLQDLFVWDPANGLHPTGIRPTTSHTDHAARYGVSWPAHLFTP